MNTNWEEQFNSDFDPETHWQGDDWVTQKLKDFISKTIQQEVQKEREQVYKLVKEWNPLLQDHSQCPMKETCIGYMGAESDFENEKDNILSMINQ